MKTSFLCNRSIIFYIYIFGIIPIFTIPIVILTTHQINILYILFIPFTFFIILFVFRKSCLSKIEITEEGIAKTYKKNIIKKIKWDDLCSVKSVPLYNLIFMDKDINKIEILNSYKTNICFRVNKKNILILSHYKKYFKDKIIDLKILNNYYQDILLK